MRDLITPRNVLLAALCFSLVALATAYGAEYIGGIKACHLCYYQRYFQFVASGICLLALLSRYYYTGIFAVGFTYLGNAGLAFYQVLVEKKIVPLPESCKAPALTYNNFNEFKEKMLATPHVACDHVSWSLFGISMAGYGAIFTIIAGLVYVILGIMYVKKSRFLHGP